MQLRDNAATRALYPFGFALEVDYTLSPTSLAANFTVHNLGAEALPYALGLHPGFVFPLAGGAPQAHEVVFDEERFAASSSDRTRRADRAGLSQGAARKRQIAARARAVRQ